MSFLQRLIVASTLAVLATCLTEQKEIQVPRGREITVQNPDYPQTSPQPTTSLIWTLVSPPGTQILLECSDVRISPSTNCDNGFFVITHSGGKTPHYCGTTSGLKITSPDNRMIVHFELTWAAGVFNCKAKSEGVAEHPQKPNKPQLNGEKINLSVDEVRYHDINMNPMPQIDKLYHWEYTTQPGYKIGIRCTSLWMGNHQNRSECAEGYFSFDLGKEEVQFCNNSNGLSLASSGEKLGFTVKSTRNIMGGFQCIVLSTKGPYFEQYKNEPDLPEEDSSEYGHPQKKGPKRTTCECGSANKPAPARILHGDYVSPHEFPWMAGLLKSEQALQTFCGGTIITRRHVISASHCTLKTVATHVVVGTDHMAKREGGKIYPVEKIINHDNENKSEFAPSKDISVLIMAEEIQFGHNVGAACLPTRDPNLLNQPVVTMGWGGIAFDEMGRDYSQLKKAKLRVISMESCNPVWDGRWTVSPASQICTWNKRQDVCYGDSGGPVVWLDPETNRYTLVGIPSVCDGCRLQKPSIHTALHYYYPWLMDVIRSNNHGDQKVCTKID
uniref:Venom S1 protease with CUB domain 13 n=1 Tax=Platymeris rhadamanthus TaxID=1134088 RepID=A0A6B9KZG9_PLARH|nr:venom S1 protease with CUB domain 13 [Platymeris rhadamanthus]